MISAGYNNPRREAFLQNQRSREQLDAIAAARPARCSTCNAPPVIIHHTDCPHANRAQRIGKRPRRDYATTH